MKSIYLQNIKSRLNFNKIEKKIKIYNFLKNFLLNKKKFFINNKNIFLNILLFSFKISYSKTYIVNRCILTNRSRGVLRKFKINRILLQKFLKLGYVPGYKKAQW